MFRTAIGLPEIHPGFVNPTPVGTHDLLQSIVLRQDGRTLALPVDQQLATLIPYRGPGDAKGGSSVHLSVGRSGWRAPTGPTQGSIGAGWVHRAWLADLRDASGQNLPWRRNPCQRLVGLPGWQKHRPGPTMPPGSMCCSSSAQGCF